MEQWRLSLQPRDIIKLLIGSSWSYGNTSKLWKLTLELWKLILKLWRLTLSVESHPGAVEALHGAVQAHQET
jgi:hypothetical protein